MNNENGCEGGQISCYLLSYEITKINESTKKPTLFYNKKMKKKKQKYIIGIDEVGRGPLAGPVTVAAVVLPKNLESRIKNLELPLRDSKRLSSRQREIWFDYIKAHPKIFYALASVSPKIIDKINISQAANLAARRALKRLSDYYKLQKGAGKILLDGGLKISPPKYLKPKSYKLKTLIRGDEKIPAIMLASIVAKVSRDRLMTKLHKKYPRYGFSQHKGYGTKKHIKAIKKYGPSKVHRLTFLRKILRINPKDKLF